MVSALVEVLRPFNCMLAGAASIIGLLLGGSSEPELAAVAFLSVFAITGAGNAINDYYDRMIDAVNRPARPIPSGRISPGSAFACSLLLFLAGCLMAYALGPICASLAALNSIMLIVYARNLKSMPLLGNLSVAYLTGSTFLFGGAAAGGILQNVIPFLLSSLATLSREIVKDIEDIKGDRLGGARTLPILTGERFSSALAAAFALAAVALSPIPPLGAAYTAAILLADLLLLYSVYRIARGDAAGSQRMLKSGMALALLAFLAGALEGIGL